MANMTLQGAVKLFLQQGWNDVTSTNVLLAHRHSHSHISTRTFRLAHNQSLAHHRARTCTFHVCSHIMTGPLAHFDSHILTNHSHIAVGLLAHSMFTRTLWSDHSHISTRTSRHSHIMGTTRTSLYSHIMTAPLAHFDSHIPCSLAHYDRTTRTFRCCKPVK